MFVWVLGNIGAILEQYWVISGDIGIISSSVKSVRCIGQGQFKSYQVSYFLVNLVWPCRIRYITILLKTTDIVNTACNITHICLVFRGTLINASTQDALVW